MLNKYSLLFIETIIIFDSYLKGESLEFAYLTVIIFVGISSPFSFLK